MSPAIARKVIDHFQDEPARLGQLSSRQREVLVCLSEGLAYKQIAARLDVSLNTVRKHTAGIYEKLHVHSRTEAVVHFLRQGGNYPRNQPRM